MRVADLTVIGGGIVGLGIARSAVRRGMTVVVLERAALAAETSANSHGIIHSGIRYVQHGAMARVVASARALAELRSHYPECVAPLPCWMPLRGAGLRGGMALKGGHFLYRTALRAQGIAVPQWRGVVASAQLPNHPLLRGRCAGGAFGWEDGWLCDHQGLVVRVRQEIELGGGIVHEHTPVGRVVRNAKGFVVEATSGEITRCASVVDARGPSIRHSLLEGESAAVGRATGEWCLGFNVSLSIDISQGCGVAVSTSGGRLLFVAPRRGIGGAHSAIGTGYLGVEGERVPVVTEEHVASLVHAVAEATGVRVSLSDVVGVESGILPRSTTVHHEVVADASTRLFSHQGFLVVQSGKYTTFPVVGEQVIAAVQRWMNWRK